MPFVQVDAHPCRHCNSDVTEWYAQPSSGQVIYSGKCAACYRATRAVRVAAAKSEASARGLLVRPASSVAREHAVREHAYEAAVPMSVHVEHQSFESDQAWEPLIAAVAAAPGPDAQRQQLLKHSLRLVTWSYRPELASPAVAEHIRIEHHNRPFRTCDHRFMERAHPVDVAALAREIAAGSVSVAEAIRRLRPIVYLTREEHRAVGDFRTRESVEKALGVRLVEWRSHSTWRSTPTSKI
jgi:hypothetical protein